MSEPRRGSRLACDASRKVGQWATGSANASRSQLISPPVHITSEVFVFLLSETEKRLLLMDIFPQGAFYFLPICHRLFEIQVAHQLYTTNKLACCRYTGPLIKKKPDSRLHGKNSLIVFIYLFNCSGKSLCLLN